jgi:adenylylsulfate kinase
MLKKINKKKGILFWIEGFSGSGKTTLSKKILNYVKSNFGPTILIQGNDIRKFLNLQGYTKTERIESSNYSSNFVKFILDQNINIVYTVVCLNNKARNLYKSKVKNMILIYLKSDIKKIIKFNKKKMIYKYKKNIVGVDIKAEYPKESTIQIENNFKKNLHVLSNELINKIKKLKIC